MKHIDIEVDNLFKLKDKTQFANALLDLQTKYPKEEDIINKIQKIFIKRHSKIVKKAKKFADAVQEKYSNIPYHILLLKLRKYADKHNMSDAEFTEFQRIYESGSNQVIIPVTNLMKVLGNVTSGLDNFANGNLDEKEFRDLQEILKLHEYNKRLHAQTLLQSIGYTDCAPQVITASLDKKWMNPADHVHPVVAAMFIPKINIFEENFLFSNISGIIKARYNAEPLVTRSDYNLFYDLVTDPNDVVCNVNSPMSDLLHRSNLQAQLWNSVLNLRNGQPFGRFDLVNSIDVCRLNKYDNPDFIYGRHDGTILKRLLASFSFRPTVISTTPINNIFNPYSQNMRQTVTSIPMINVRLLYKTPFKLSLSLHQPQQFIENDVLVTRISQVIYSREVLIFFIDRRANVLEFMNQPFSVSRLPSAIASFERININKIEFEKKIRVQENDFTLRSVVIAEISANKKMVIGSSTFIIEDSDKPFLPIISSIMYHYRPFNSIKRANNDAIYDVDSGESSVSLNKNDAIKTIETQSIIYIYQNTVKKSSL